MNFSLYRGDMHKVPDAPRRWPLSKPSISLQTFKKALDKRQQAVDRLAQTSDATPSSPCHSPAAAASTAAHACNGSMDDSGHGILPPPQESVVPGSSAEQRKRKPEDPSHPGRKVARLDDEDQGKAKGGRRSSKDGTRGTDAANHDASEADNAVGRRLESDGMGSGQEYAKSDRIVSKTAGEDILISCEAVVFRQVSQKEKRKAELEEKLKELNEEKHQLVQRLKQVLNSEEESRKHNQASLQSPAFLSSSTVLPAEVPNSTIQSDGRLRVESHSSAELEEGELDYTQTPSPSPRFSSGTQFNSFTGNAMFVPSPSSTGRHSRSSQRLSQTWRWHTPC